MKPQIPVLGTFCTSAQGRDMGRNYLIVKVLDPDFVLVADGTARKINNPKKKRVKHLKIGAERTDEKTLLKLLKGTLKDNELHRLLIAKENKNG